MFSRATALQSTCSTTGILALRSKGSKRMPSGDGQPRHSLGRAGGRLTVFPSPPIIIIITREAKGGHPSSASGPGARGRCIWPRSRTDAAAGRRQPSWRGHLGAAILQTQSSRRGGAPRAPLPGPPAAGTPPNAELAPQAGPSSLEPPARSRPRGPGQGVGARVGACRCSPPPRHITS